MGNGNGPAPDCTGSLCGFGAAKGDVGCHSGDGSCWSADMIGAEESVFHTSELREATTQIRSILDSIQSPGDGRKLSFVHTRMGTVLAWVNHGQPLSPDAVTSANTDEEIAEALGLILDSGQAVQAY